MTPGEEDSSIDVVTDEECLVVVFVSAEEEDGKLAKADRAARMAGVSVRTWRARLTLSERTLVDFIIAAAGAAGNSLVLLMISFG